MRYPLTSSILHHVPHLCRELFEIIYENFISDNSSS